MALFRDRSSGRTAGKTGNALGNDQSGTWVRVAEWLSGANWGSHFLPRIGTEVMVDFLDGDIDRPIIVGQAYNGADLPPFSAGHEAGANHPGVLSDWMSHNHESGFNQWVTDDGVLISYRDDLYPVNVTPAFCEHG